MDKLTFTVEQHMIHVNSIRVLKHTEDVIMLSIDCKQKYPDVEYGGDGRIYIGATERTLGVGNKEDLDTVVSINNLPSSWTEDGGNIRACTSAGRYSVNMVLIKYTDAEQYEGEWVAE